MNVFDAIQKRRSIRLFQRKSIEEEKLQRVLDAARLAPTARNMQEWKIVVVRDRAMREQLMRAAGNQSFVALAPVVLVACGTIANYTMRCGQLSYPIDTAIALDHMTLQAVEEGLGTCWVCAFSEPEIKELLAIPADVRVVALLALGYPGESPAPRPRKAIDELVCYDRFS